jgi:hypothetical protein
MREQEARELQRMVRSQGRKVLKVIMNERIEALSEAIFNKDTSWEDVIILRAERTAIDLVLEQPALEVLAFNPEFETEEP